MFTKIYKLLLCLFIQTQTYNMSFLKKYWGLMLGGLTLITIGVKQLSKNNDEYVLNLVSDVVWFSFKTKLIR